MRRFLKSLAVSLGLLTAACAPQAGQTTTTVDYRQIVADTKIALQLLEVQANAQVSAGKLDAAKVHLAEQTADAAVAALDATGGSVQLSAQGVARAALTALDAFQALMPSAFLTPPVLTALTVAETGLTVFLALDPGTAALVRHAQRPVTVIMPAPSSPE